MSTFIIPVSETTDAFDEQVELGGRVYNLAFHWNSRDGHWFMDIYRDGTLQLAGVKLIVTSNLLSQYHRNEELPDGILSIEDLDGEDNDPDAENFGDRVVLKYTEAV